MFRVSRATAAPSCGRALWRSDSCMRAALSAALLVLVNGRGLAVADWQVVSLHPATALSSIGIAASGGLQVGRADLVGVGMSAVSWSGSAGSISTIHPGGSFADAADGQNKAGEANNRAALWRGAMNEYVDLHPVGAQSSRVWGLWGDTQVGESYWSGPNAPVQGYRASIWTGTAASWLDVSPPGAVDAELAAVDASGQVGIFAYEFGRLHAALWHGTAESVVDLHPAGAYASSAQAISNGRQGGHVQFVRDGPSHAALWSGTAESFFDLTPSGGPTVAGVIYGMDGDVQVGQAGFLDGSGGATVWFGTPESAFYLGSLLSSDYTETWAYAVDIDEFGTIRVVGSAYNNNYYLPDGTYFPRNEAMMWVLVPEPSSLAALVAGLAGLAGVRPRRRR